MPAISLRPITPADRDFLYGVYASTRQAEMELLPWTDAQKDEFLTSQFHAQRQFYQQQFSNACFDVILLDERPVGRLYVDRRRDQICIIDISVLPSYRGQGIGRRLIENVLTEAAANDKPVRIHVEQNNPALRLYQRLGFVKVEDQDVYDLMVWHPPGK